MVGLKSSPSLSDETLSCGPVSWGALKPEPLLVEPDATRHKTTKKHKLTRPSTGYSQGTATNIIIWSLEK